MLLIMHSPFYRATTEGVVLAPSALSDDDRLAASMTATQELVVQVDSYYFSIMISSFPITRMFQIQKLKYIKISVGDLTIAWQMTLPSMA